MKDRLILDVDGVVADFTGELLRVVKSPLTTKDITKWNVFEFLDKTQTHLGKDALADLIWWARLPTLPGSVQAVQKLQSRYEIFWVTSPWTTCFGWENARRNWLSRKFDTEPDHIVIASYKGIIGGDVMIDDKPDNIREWSKHNPDKLALLFDAPYNRDDGLTGYQWSQILEKLDIK